MITAGPAYSAAAVPVVTKMPAPTTLAMPRAVRLHRPERLGIRAGRGRPKPAGDFPRRSGFTFCHDGDPLRVRPGRWTRNGRGETGEGAGSQAEAATRRRRESATSASPNSTRCASAGSTPTRRASSATTPSPRSAPRTPTSPPTPRPGTRCRIAGRLMTIAATAGSSSPTSRTRPGPSRCLANRDGLRRASSHDAERPRPRRLDRRRRRR